MQNPIELEVVTILRELAESVERIASRMRRSVESSMSCVVESEENDLTVAQKVAATLRESGGRRLTVNEIVSRTGLNPSAVRMALYSNRGKLFEQHQISPRRMRWSVIGVESHQTREETLTGKLAAV